MTHTSFSFCHFAPAPHPSPLIYLDHAAATPTSLEAFAAMEPALLTHFANPANRLHAMGEWAEHALAAARAAVAKSVDLTAEEVVFCSSATEANNLVLRGSVENLLRKRTRIVVGATEHSAVVATAHALARNYGVSHGIEVVELPVDSNGQINLEGARHMINSQTLCVCVMDVNNETGICQLALPEIIEHAHAQGAFVHVDAVQGFARGHFSASQLNFDTAVLSSAKIYGPKGAAALLLRKRKPRLRIEPQLTGGGQEFLIRSGTPNLPAILGFAKAAEITAAHKPKIRAHLQALEDMFVETLQANIDAHIHGLHATRVPGILMVSIPGTNAMKLIEVAKHVCISAGSACKTLQATASHVLLAMGVDDAEALAGFRVSFGLPNTLAEARASALWLAQKAQELRAECATLS